MLQFDGCPAVCQEGVLHAAELSSGDRVVAGRFAPRCGVAGEHDSIGHQLVVVFCVFLVPTTHTTWGHGHAVRLVHAVQTWGGEPSTYTTNLSRKFRVRCKRCVLQPTLSDTWVAAVNEKKALKNLLLRQLSPSMRNTSSLPSTINQDLHN